MTSGMKSAVLSYSKWDNLVDSDDEFEAADATEADRTPAAELGRKFIRQWLVEASPELDCYGGHQELQELTTFIERQVPKLGESDNRSSAAAITSFLESKRMPRTAPLVAAVAASQTRELSSIAEAERPAAARVRAAMTSALNTLCACKEHGGPRRLFEAMREAPDGEMARRYASMSYAAAAVTAYSEHVLRATASRKADAEKSLPKLRAPSSPHNPKMGVPRTKEERLAAAEATAKARAAAQAAQEEEENEGLRKRAAAAATKEESGIEEVEENDDPDQPKTTSVTIKRTAPMWVIVPTVILIVVFAVLFILMSVGLGRLVYGARYPATTREALAAAAPPPSGMPDEL